MIPSFSVVDRNELPRDTKSEMDNLSEWIKELASYDGIYVKHSNIECLNLPLSFDIETSSWRDTKGNPRATMYAFVVGVYGKVFVGRTWDDFLSMLNDIVASFSLVNSVKQ